MQPSEYNPNVPENPSDSLADSQPEFLENFLTLYNTFLVNHVALDDPSTMPVIRGNHTIIELVEQDHSFQTDLGEISVYTKDVPGQTDQVFLKYQGSAGQEFQFTNYQIYSVDSTNFFTFLPGRNILYFGSFVSLPSNILTLTPPIARVIISINFCPIGAASNRTNYKPWAGLIASDTGFFNKITVNPAAIGGIIPPCFYMVMANT
jgi:hypothetical protein